MYCKSSLRKSAQRLYKCSLGIERHFDIDFVIVQILKLLHECILELRTIIKPITSSCKQMVINVCYACTTSNDYFEASYSLNCE